MLKIKKQISRLYLSSVLGNLSLTGAWVAILSVRGYSLTEIGFAETVFHITSILFEIPSGVLADLFGRKRMLIVSSIIRLLGNIVMIFSCNLFMVCTSIAFYAMSYNFSSGSGEALAYDSLKSAGEETYYEKYASNQLAIYRLCSGISTLCAGFALLIGHKAAYGTDILMCAVQIWVLMSLWEAGVCGKDRGSFKNVSRSIGKEFMQCFLSSISFIKNEKRTIFLMFCNSLVGAVDILLLFFLQAKLPAAGIPEWGLGFALFFMEMGGILGAKAILRCKKLSYRSVFLVTGAFVLSGVFMEHSPSYIIMALGGFAAAFGDDALQVRTNRILQDMFPSEQRATLISMESFTFSMIMIILSPLAGVLFSYW